MMRLEMGMDKLTQRWMIQHAARNYWRVAAFIDLEDLIQDGHMVFMRVKKKYAGRRDYAHITNTFKASFINHIHDLAKDRSRAPVEVHDVLDYESIMPTEPELQSFLTILSRAPFRVAEALKVFCTDEGLAMLRRPYRIREDDTRETLNERLCKLAGFDPERVDLATELRKFLSD